MQLRVVTDQPWDVPADVLVVPIAAKPAFDGPLGELDRRAGGELRTLVAFGEFSGKRYAPRCRRAARLEPAGCWRSGWATRPRSTARPSAGSRPRRSGGSAAERSSASRSGSTPLADGLDGDAAVAAGLVARGVARGHLRPADDLSRRGRLGAADPRRADPDRPGRRRRGADQGRRARHRHRRGRERRADARPTVPRTTSARRSSPTRRAPIAEKHGLWIDVIEPTRRPRWGWACSWPSAVAATTRRR